MLTIGELAKLAATTVRAVRHYHSVGVLAEPERDASGYRRYRASDLVRLIRIRQLREIGVPLERVRAIIDDDESVEGALAVLDAELAQREAEIADQRAKLAALRRTPGDRELPAPLGELFAEYAARSVARAPRPAGSQQPAGAGLDSDFEREKEALLLLLALSPAALGDLVETYRRMLTDSGLAARMAELDRRFAALAEEPELSPAVESLVEAVLSDPDVAREIATTDPDDRLAPKTLDLLRDFLTGEYSPAQRRFVELVLARAEAALSDISKLG